jgi:predicted transcriptional regulator
MPHMAYPSFKKRNIMKNYLTMSAIAAALLLMTFAGQVDRAGAAPDATLQPDMTVRDVMATNVLIISSTNTIADAFRMIQEHNLPRLSVVDTEGRLLGLVTRHIVTVSPDATVAEATAKAKAANVGAVNVVESGGKMVGLWTVGKNESGK